MADIYITAMGELWGNGITVESVDFANDGWVYLSGVETGIKDDTNIEKTSPTVLAYHNGELVWKQHFAVASNGFATFKSVTYKDGYVYVAGDVSPTFDPTTFGGQTFPTGKPALEERLYKWAGSSEASTASAFAKINADTGELVFAKVLDSQAQGADPLRSIQVDSSGNMYVSGGGWTPGPDLNKPLDGGSFYFYTRKFAPDGTQLWQKDGGGSIQTTNDGYTTTTSASDIVKLDPNGNVVQTFVTNSPSWTDQDNYPMNQYIFDSSGDIYIAYTHDNRAKLGEVFASAGHYSTLITKVSGSSGQVLWSNELDPTAFSAPASLTFDPQGNLLVAGYNIGSMNGVAASGKEDGYLITLNPSSGSVLSTTIIGTSAREQIKEVQYDANGNLLIAGAFGKHYYSLEGTDHQNIYLVSESGFTLMGNELDNAIHGSEGKDNIFAGVGNDELKGGGGADKLDGGDGNDNFLGDSGNDTLKGGNGTDTADYSSSTTNLSISLKTNKASGDGIGKDSLSKIENAKGGGGNDSITGSKATASELDGGNGNDTILGGNAGDTVIGGAGDDTLVGGGGNDTLTGGLGNDIFKFDSKLTTKKIDGVLTATNVDNITDFTSGTDDINLSKKIFTAYKLVADLTDSDLASFDSTAGGTVLTAADTTSRHFLYDTGTGNLYYDADGSGNKAAVQFATLTGHPTLAATDLHIV